MSRRILITGAAGYIGGMLCERLAQRDDVEAILGLDLAPMPAPLRDNAKISWLRGAIEHAGWQAAADAAAPDVVIHTAWFIRQRYGDTSGRNLAASNAVFDFAFAAPTVQRLVHFSSVASYGSGPANSIAQRFTESAPLVPSDFAYAEEKRLAELQLEEMFAASDRSTQVVVVRPAAVTGPRGRSRSSLLGLQSALDGTLTGSPVARLVALLMNFIPVTPEWCRQFVHEDDLVSAVTMLALDRVASSYSRFNVSPPGDPLTAKDMATAFGKRLIHIDPLLVRLAFFLAWHGSRGRIPTPRGAWASYSYPLVVDGTALTAQYGLHYRYGTKDAFTTKAGDYATRTAASPELAHQGMKTAP